MSMEILFKVCLVGMIALSAMQAYLGTKGFVAAERYEAAERVHLARPFLLLCVANVAVLAMSLVGIYAVDEIARPLAHNQAVDFRGEAIPSFVGALFTCPLYAWATGRMSFSFSRSKPWKTGQEPRVILGQVIQAAVIGTWSTLILFH